MKRLISIFLIIVLALSVGSCDDELDVRVGVYASKVEIGKYFRVPDLIGIDMDAVDVYYYTPDGEEEYCDGPFKLEEEGQYTVKYVYEGGSKQIKFTCTEDITAPQFKEKPQFNKVYNVGDYVASGYVLEKDPSGIDYSVTSVENFKYYYEDETEPCFTGFGYTIEKAGNYRIELTLKDNIGNQSIYSHEFTAVEKFEPDLPEGYLADFNSENYADLDLTRYFDFFGSADQWGDFTNDYSITTDYPDAATDGTDTVLKISPSDNGMHYAWTYTFTKPISVSDVKHVFIRYNLNKSQKHIEKYEEYPLMLYAVPYTLESGQLGSYLNQTPTKAVSFAFGEGKWTTTRLSIDSLIQNSGETELNGIQLCTDGDLYIDSIWFDNEEFIDTNKEEKVLMDFDESAYLYQVEKGIIGDSPEITHLTEGYPNATENNGVIKIASKSLKGSTVAANIKLFEPINASEHEKINFRIYYDGRISGTYIVKALLVFQNKNLTSHSEDNRRWFNHFIDNNNATQYYENWKDVSVDSSIFANEDGMIDTLNVLLEGTLYIDKIWVE